MPPGSRVRLPEWLVRVLAAVYAAAGAGVMVLGASTVCGPDARRNGFCRTAFDDHLWPALVLLPAGASVLVVRLLPPDGPARRYAWIVLAVVDVVLTCFGLVAGVPTPEFAG